MEQGLGTLTGQQLMLSKELERRGSMSSLQNLIKGATLDWFQTKALMQCIVSKGSIVSLDTGLGKTLVAIGLMNFWNAMANKSKTLYVCERSNYENTIAKIEKHSNLKVKGTTAESAKLVKVLFEVQPEEYDVLVVTYQGLQNQGLNEFLFDFKHLFKNVVVDESHTIGNDSSFTYQIVRGILKGAENKVFLTATPLRTSPRQIINQYEMLDREAFSDKDNFARQFEVYDETGKLIGHKDLEELGRLLRHRFIGYTRAELGMRGNYDIKVDLVQPMQNHMNVSRVDMNKVIKGDPDGNAVKQAEARIRQYTNEGKKGLVYCNTNDNKRMLLDRFKNAGIRVDIIDGSISNVKNRNAVQHAFNNGAYDVIITNITTALDMQCDYILFYEMTVDSKQMIGRGERGLKGNDLELVYILTKDTVEIEYFIENVYDRAVMLKKIAGKDMQELEEVRRRL